MRFRGSRLLVLCLCLFFSLNSSARDVPKPKLMLANIYHQGVDLNDYWVSEKYDGVRALWNGEQLISRGGNIYHAPAWFIENFPKQPLDGELWISRQSFETLLSTVRDTVPNELAWQSVKYMVFDLPDDATQFDTRLINLENMITKLNIPWLVFVKQRKFKTHEDLMVYLNELVKQGAEGLMLHKGSSLYRGKRTGDLLKLKKFEDAEAKVIEHIEGNGKYQGMMGAIRVEMASGITFKIGSGFTDAERENPPQLGSRVTFQFSGLTKNGIPKFATYLRMRKAE